MEKPLSELSLEELWALFPIVLKAHNPAYFEWYWTEKEELIKIIGANDIKRMNHIGSSAVTGLLSKPTIDILLEVDQTCNPREIKERLNYAGWIQMAHKNAPDLRMSFNKGYTPKGFDQKVYHLHVRYLGDWDELYFRDYLILHQEVSEAYAQLKLSLKEKYEYHRDAYTEGKTVFVTKWSKIAREELNCRYDPDKNN